MALVKPRYGKSLTTPYSKPSIEKKNIDAQGSTGNGVANGFSEIDHINIIAQGTTSNSRVGRKIQMKSVFLRWYTSTSLNCAPIRIMIVYDRNPQQQMPLLNEILTGNGFNNNLNLDNADRFVVIADEVHNSNYAVGAAQFSGTIYRKLNLDAIYSGTTGDITTQTSGAVLVLSCGLAGIGAGIGYHSRIRYTDI